MEDLLISFLPAEKVILAQQNEITGAAMSTARVEQMDWNGICDIIKEVSGS
ncbi:MAG: hypothetical protein IJT34_00330 [Butyrivibrio sp.]|nr:hypothetical protein [Butyrivibrio sp.]